MEMGLDMGFFEVISLILNVILSGSLIVTLITLKSTKRKAAAEARSAEIANSEAVARMWQNLAEKMTEKHDELAVDVRRLTVEVNRLKNATNRIVRLLDRITPENLEEMIKKIKDEIDIEHSDIRADIITGADQL